MSIKSIFVFSMWTLHIGDNYTQLLRNTKIAPKGSSQCCFDESNESAPVLSLYDNWRAVLSVRLAGVCESIQRDLMMKAKIICHCIYFLLAVQKVKSEQSSSFLCWMLNERRQKQWVSAGFWVFLGSFLFPTCKSYNKTAIFFFPLGCRKPKSI